MKFTYSSGDRPLDGYTIKRGIGQGGFGEVYYALSDGGKEVAIKLVRGNLEVELRGMAQCLNLKHPNLVSLFDIKTDGHGDSWVVMEYVSGESLSGVLGRHPRGLPLDLARQWFIALSKAIGYLHENGIVHRDLKPANIFVEAGLVKVGDYGLCKFISGSQRSAQTQSVGTVHYMAPEISTGNYGKQVDVYAAGVILYEMISGRVPFDGESAGEILMKHLTTNPDLSKLPSAYQQIVGTALAKNPAHRYQSIGDMALALDRLGGGSPVIEVVAAASPKPRPVAMTSSNAPLALPAGLSGREKIAELSVAMILATVLAGLFAIGWKAIDHSRDIAQFGGAFLMLVLTTWAVLIPAKFWDYKRGDPWFRRMVMLMMGLFLGLGSAWLNGWSFESLLPKANTATGPLLADASADTMSYSRLFGYLAYFGGAFFLLRWWKLADRTRFRRFGMFPVILAGCLSWILIPLWPDFNSRSVDVNMIAGPIVLTLSAVIVQIVSPWEEPAPRPIRRVRLRYA